jgi:hypothetical protein
MLFIGSTPVGGPIVGWISQRFGARYAIAVGAAAALGAGAWGFARSRPSVAVPLTDTEAHESVADGVREDAAPTPAIPEAVR